MNATLPAHAQHVATAKDGSTLWSWMTSGGAYSCGQRCYGIRLPDGTARGWEKPRSPERGSGPKAPPAGGRWAWIKD